jgi:hypothetical protein
MLTRGNNTGIFREHLSRPLLAGYDDAMAKHLRAAGEAVLLELKNGKRLRERTPDK